MDFALNLKSDDISSLIKSGNSTESPEYKKEILIPENLSDEEKIIYSIKNNFCDVDSISHLTKIPLNDLNVILLMLEMSGRIKSDNGIYNLTD